MSTNTLQQVKIEVWADLVCPWCGLGRHRLDAALERFEHAGDVTVVHRSFELDREAPIGVTRPVSEFLARKGLDDVQVEATTRMIEDLAASEGLTPYIVKDNVTGSTALAHELLAYATDEGLGRSAWERAFRWYFGEGRSIFDVEPLVELATEIGLEREAAREVLVSRRYSARRLEDRAQARRLGVTGVPFFVINDRYGISGAQRTELLLDALSRAWIELHG
jgi:predicted DsbA family dithiol-disulfide isomerase